MSEIVDMTHLRLTDRPLVVCDVDDVVLEFLSPFEGFLNSLGHKLVPRSYRLHGNILSTQDDRPLAEDHVTQLIQDFFAAQEAWQTPFGDAVHTLKRLADEADVVFLTAMPPRFTQMRRRLLDSLDLTYPLLATESPKGPVLAHIHGDRGLPVAFIDDMVHNHHSVALAVPECLLVHLMPQSAMHSHAPKPTGNVLCAQDWAEVERFLLSHFQTR